MALQWIFFGAHEGSDVGPGESEGAIDTFGEIRGATARGVINEAVFPVDARIGGPSAESFPEKFVANAGRRKAALERLAIELRETEACGTAADVAKCMDTMLRKDGEKNLEFETRMTDREKRISLGGVGIHEMCIRPSVFCRNAGETASTGVRRGILAFCGG
jgi:hypothetical protein